MSHLFEVVASVPRKAQSGHYYTEQVSIQTIGWQRAQDWKMYLARKHNLKERAITIQRLKQERT